MLLSCRCEYKYTKLTSKVWRTYEVRAWAHIAERLISYKSQYWKLKRINVAVVAFGRGPCYSVIISSSFSPLPPSLSLPMMFLFIHPCRSVSLLLFVFFFVTLSFCLHLDMVLLLLVRVFNSSAFAAFFLVWWLRIEYGFCSISRFQRSEAYSSVLYWVLLWDLCGGVAKMIWRCDDSRTKKNHPEYILYVCEGMKFIYILLNVGTGAEHWIERVCLRDDGLL